MSLAPETEPRPETESEPNAPRFGRLFLFEPGWQIAQKVGSSRLFCYAMNPGEEFYHRISDGEIFLYNAEERYCIPCALRRNLLSFEPRNLREPLAPLDL